jgi:hypothetical protein
MSDGVSNAVIAEDSREFRTSLDTFAIVVSCVACGILLAAAAFAQSLLAGGLAVLVMAGAYAWSPRAYVVSARQVVVKRLIGDVVFALEGLAEMRRAGGDDMRGCVRIWGNGGLFGYYGLFRTSGLGRCTWYVTRRSNAVVLVTNRRTALFSPDDVDGFLAAIRAAVPELPPDGLRANASAGSRRTWWIPAAIGGAALAIAAGALLYSPGPPAYTLGAGTLEIHDRFYPVTLQAAEVDLGHVRVVDLDEETAWRPTLRTNGFGNPHYQAGWFQTAGGTKIRLYRAGGRRLVLLPPSGASVPVLLQVKDPDEFIAGLRRAWAHAK